MSKEGKQLLESTRNFRTYLENIGKLLSTAESMLIKKGFKTKDLRAVDKRESTSIKWPVYWLLYDAFRFLTHESNNRLLVVISVIIDFGDDEPPLNQPIVSAAWFKYGKAVGNSWAYEFSRTILSVQEYSLDGKMMDIPPETEIIDGYKILSSQALAVPLVEIQSDRDIEEKIISPLIESINGRYL